VIVAIGVVIGIAIGGLLYVYWDQAVPIAGRVFLMIAGTLPGPAWTDFRVASRPKEPLNF
jgi:hypothetical protein